MLVLAGLNLAYNRDLIQGLPVFAGALSNPQLVGAIDSANIQLNLLAERGQTVGGHIGGVLGVYVQPNEDAQQPVHQRAFEYARYQYCQQVVRDFEGEQREAVDDEVENGKDEKAGSTNNGGKTSPTEQSSINHRPASISHQLNMNLEPSRVSY